MLLFAKSTCNVETRLQNQLVDKTSHHILNSPIETVVSLSTENLPHSCSLFN